MPTVDDLRRVAAASFGWEELRPAQVEAMTALLDGHDVLCVMPTGSGKSAVYQVPALVLDGPTVVVSPLIALQRDQVAHLAESDAPEAVAVNSAQRVGDTQHAWESLRTGTAEFVFLAPEQLANDEVVARLADARPSLLVVDEAHCVSNWGHDFRPDYLRIGDVLERLGRPAVAALTATAAPPVREEIVERLRMRDPRQVVRGFDRPNLHLAARRFVTDRDKRAAVVDEVLARPGTGLVYASTRKDTEAYAEALTQAGRSAAAYHAGLKAAQRREVHEAFLAGEVEVVAATSAFGMGIDKPDVRFVVHAAVPESLDSYYQEIGRCGRDGEPADVVLAYRPEDLGLRRFFAAGGPDEETLRDVAGALHAADGPLKATDLARITGRSRPRVTSALNLLELAGAADIDGAGAEYDDEERRVAEVVAAAMALAESRGRVEQSRIEMMRGYAETTGCRRQFLLGYFGEQLDEPCGHCDTCEAAAAAGLDPGEEHEVPEEVSAAYPVNSHVEHAEWGPGVVMHLEEDRITVLFETVGYRTLAVAAIEARDLLDVVDA